MGCDVDGGNGWTPQFEPLVCPDTASTPETLGEKAMEFDRLAQALHVRPGQAQLYSVRLAEDLATFERVDLSDNVGTWTSLYAASQAFRYAATDDPEALDNLRRVIRGERDMLEVTGVRGLFTRVMIDPSLPGFPSGEQLAAMYPDCDLTQGHCKRFNEVTQGPWAGWWFKNDVSKDEYAAHMFSMAVAWELVQDPQVREDVRAVVEAVGDHLIDHELKLIDIDGRVTAYGMLYAMSFNDFPGFNALLSLSWMRLAAAVGEGRYLDFYEDCLLQRRGPLECIHEASEQPQPYTSYLDQVGLDLGCMTNWNNHNMAQLGMYGLLRTERDPALRSVYHQALRDALWDAEEERPMRVQKKSLYTFFYLVNKDPTDPWPAAEAAEALCTLQTFPAWKSYAQPVDTLSRYPTVCTDRSGDPLTDVVIPVTERTMDNFVWINNPYKLEQAPADPRTLESPEDYLLAYWMGRYFGFLRAEM